MESTTRTSGCAGHHHRQDGVQVGFRDHQQIARDGAQPLAAQPDLLDRFFAGDIQDFVVVACQTEKDLEHQGRFADARVPADQHQRAAHQAAAQNPVKLLQVGLEAFFVVDVDRVDGDRPGPRACQLRRHAGNGVIPPDLFQQTVPLAAVRAFAHPFGGLVTTCLAYENGFDTLFGHASPDLKRGKLHEPEKRQKPDGFEKSAKCKTRKSLGVRRTPLRRSDFEMQRNAEMGLFAEPPSFTPGTIACPPGPAQDARLMEPQSFSQSESLEKIAPYRYEWFYIRDELMMNFKIGKHALRRCSLACALWALVLIVCQESVWAKGRLDYFGVLAERLVADGFDAGQIRQLYARPEVTFEARGLSLFFRHREATLDYDQFSTPESIGKARGYLAHNEPAFSRVEGDYGVDREIITAIMLVESRLGTVKGRRLVLNVLSSMAALTEPDVQELLWSQIADFSTLSRADFDTWVQRRSGWAYRELKAFLAYAGREQIDPAAVNGSYAGALGYAQFMPSSVLAYARDGNGDGRIDLFDHPDAIASIANYLKAAGWHPGIDREKASKVIFQYNRSSYYVDTILKVADLLKGQA